MKKSHHFSLIEIIISLVILALFVATTATFFPKIDAYQFSENQKKIEKFFINSRNLAITEQRDLSIELNNDKNELSVSLLDTSSGKKILKKRVLKNFLLEKEKNFCIYFSSTGWVFPMKTLQFIGKAKDQKKEYDLSLFFSLQLKEEKIEKIYPFKS